jgi:steroid delta-isomerase-like uncharacterized protein
MASRNVEVIRAAHQSWNARDFEGVTRDVAENLVYTDRARNLTLSSKQQFKEWTEVWATGFPDGQITGAQYIDAGDIVVAQFTLEGTNTGRFLGLPPTGRRVSCSYREVSRFDKSGRTVSGDGYYDQYTVLTQLGHIEPVSAAA